MEIRTYYAIGIFTGFFIWGYLQRLPN